MKDTKRTTYSIRDLLHRLDVVARNKLVIGVEELNTRLLERALGEQETLDTRQTLVRVVIGLLNQCQLLTLRLIQATLDGVRFLQFLEGKDEEFGVVLVILGTAANANQWHYLECKTPVRTGRESARTCDSRASAP